MKRFLYAFTLSLLFYKPAKAQLSGTYNVPATFTSVAAAINSLNIAGVSGSVTIEIAAGYTETIPTGGYTLYALAGASATSQVTFQKSGTGANPILYAYSGGTHYAYDYTQDGMFWLLGADYITIDQIDLYDPNTSNPATMEVGYGLFKQNGGNGCHYNTIKNCVVTLQRTNADATNIYNLGDGSRGIQLANSLPTTYNNPSAPSVTVFAGTNSYNSILSNTVQNCHTGISVCGTVSAVSLSIGDSGNNILNNTIINFGGGGTGNSAGIVTEYQASLTATGNYVNNNNGSGANGSASLRGLAIIDCSGINTAAVSNNTITLTGGGVNTNHFGINVYFGSSFSNGAVVTISNNLIANCTYTNTTYGPFKAIAYNGVSGTMHVISNTITNLSLSGSGTVTLIQPSANSIVSSNIISGVTFSGSAVINGIAGTDVSNNLVEGIGFSAPTSTGMITGCFGGTTINQNIFRDFYSAGAGTVCGISRLTTGTVNITNNSIYNFTTTSGGAGNSTFSGISLNTGTASVSGNTIFAFNVNGTSTTAANVAQGIAIYGGTLNTISRNKIYNLSAGANGGRAFGINSPSTIPVGSSPTNYISNNLIGDLNAPSAVGANQINGISMLRNSINYIYYNSIYLNASSTSSLFGSSCMSFSTSPILDLRNNILVNTSTASGTGKTLVYRRTSPTFSTHASASNNNLMYAGNPSSSRQIFSDGTTDCQTLADYKFYAMYADNNSVTELPPFVSTNGTNTNYLSIQTTTPTQVEAGAQSISTYTTDFLGNVRNNTTPDIGAWEGNYTYTDLLPPTIYGSAFTLTSSCNPGARTLSLTLGDINGIATGSLSPRLYYRVNSGSYSSIGGTLTAGTNTFGTWTFHMTYTSVPTDIIQYFVLAQDLSPANNLMSLPPTGFSGSDVNTVITPPISPLSYSVMYNLAGTYSVGASGTFTSLTQAVFAYNNGCLTSSVKYVLTNVSYGSQETFPIVFLNNPDASSTNSLLIVPQTGTYVSISSGTTTSSTLKFMGARYITLDGVNTPSTGLSVSQPTSNSHWYPTVIWLASQGTHMGNSDLTFKRLSIYSRYIGINSCRHDTLSKLGGVNNNNIRVEGNHFYRGQYAIYAAGTGSSASPYPGGINNWIIKDNVIGGTGTSTISFTGVVAQNMSNFSFTGNTLANIATIGLSIHRVIGADISHNIFRDIVDVGNNNGFMSAILISEAVNSMTISHNLIDNISYQGIYISQSYSTTTTNYIRNNMISNIKGPPCSNIGCGPTGMRIYNGGALEIDYNTINITGTISSSSYTNPGVNSSAIQITSAYPGATYKIRNNMLVNTLVYPNAPSHNRYLLYCSSPNSVIATNTQVIAMNYNNYYGGAFAWNQGTTLNSMTSMQTTFGGNLNSVSLIPTFNSSSDLHLAMVANNLALDNLGTPLPGITDDIDGQVRNMGNPDIGADEFTIPVCSGAGAGTISIASVTACAGVPFSLSSTGANIGVNAGFTWKVSTISGSSYTNVSSGTGSSTPIYHTSIPASGTYYYILSATCGTSSAVISNEATVTVNSVPSISVSSNTSSICSGRNLTLTANSLIGTNYTWTGPLGYSSTAQTSTINNITTNSSGVYTVVVSANTCTSSPVTITLSVIQTPSTILVSPSSTLICSTGAAQLVASGGQFGSGSVSFQWTPTIGLSAGTGSLVNAAPSGNSIYTVSVNNNGCVNSETVAVNVTALPSLSISSTPTAICFGESATLIASGASNYTWSTSSNSASIVVSPGGTSVYTVSNITAPCATVSKTINLTVNALPILSVTASSGTICSGQNYTLTASGAVSYSWINGPTGNQTTITPLAFDSYTVTGVNTHGCEGSNIFTVSPNPSPSISIAQSSQSVCSGFPVTFTANGASSYTWTSVAGNSVTTVTPLVPSTYTVNGENLAGCKASQMVSVGIYPAPLVNIIPSSATLCPSSSITFTATGASSYSWNSTAGSHTITYAPSGNTSYIVTGNDAITGCPGNASANVIIQPPPILQISANSLSVCPGSAATLNVSGAITYTWTNSGSHAATLSVNPSSTTVYFVSGSGNFGCVGSNSITIGIFTPGQISVASSGQTLCVGEEVTLTSSGATTYTWMPGNQNGSIFTATAQSSETFTVQGNDHNGCFTTSTVSLFVDACLNLTHYSLSGEGVKAYPSPFNNVIHIDLNFSWLKDRSVSIYSLDGKLVYKQAITQSNSVHDLQHLLKGLYFLRIDNFNVKIVKE